MRFEGRKALVTGAAGGIGQVLVTALRAEGARVAVSDRDSGAVAAEVHLDGDLRDAGICDGLPGRAAAELGGLDLLFNNAGVITRGAITEASDADYALTMGVNVEATFRVCRAAIPIMADAGGGAIVNTSSCWGRDHAHQGIRVNAVCPNEVNTTMLRSGFETRGFDPDEAVEALNKSVPIGHIAEPEEVVDVMLFLASDAARYMCGALVEVNGGKAVT